MKKSYLITLCLLVFLLVANDTTAQRRKGRGKRKGSITVPALYKVDSDGDGVADVRDQCPGTPKGQKVDKFGCPTDRDHDGIYDYEDDCPDKPGPKSNKGCPIADRDGDGVADKDDKCPDTPGPRKNHGCPYPKDRDGDGIPDDKDKCPDVRGNNNGCPDNTKKDRDGDGIPDDKDKCPDVRGNNNGCPDNTKKDTDGDGVLDKDDKCVTTPGPKSNHGCPEIINKEEKAILNKASRVEFAFGKSEIKKEWYGVLNDVAGILKKYPNAIIEMAGHTDSVGEEAKNLQLSKDRAAAVRQYLINKGIASDRITSNGYGETRPLMSNDSKEGRQVNRRVAMHIFDKSVVSQKVSKDKK